MFLLNRFINCFNLFYTHNVCVFFESVYTGRTPQFPVLFFHLYVSRKRNSIKRVADAVSKSYCGKTRGVEEREKLISSCVAEKKFKGNGADCRDPTSDHAFVSGVYVIFSPFLSLARIFVQLTYS